VEELAMRRIALAMALITGAVAAVVAWWRRHPRAGSAYMNRVVNPWLIEHGLPTSTHGEVGLVEHGGRISGTIHISPVHPVPIDGGFRIVVPLGLESEWARNVVAAGHARLQIGDFVHEVDEPMLLSPIEVPGIAPGPAHIMESLGFRYLVVHEFAANAGRLEQPVSTGLPADATVEPAPEPLPIDEQRVPAAV